MFGYQDVLEVIKNEVTSLVEGATYAQSSTHKEENTKYYKVLFLIHQCVNADNFEKVGDCTTSKQTWEILEKTYAGANKEKVVRLQTHKRQLQLIQMEEKKTICEFTIRITILVNQVKACGQIIIEKYVVAKILWQREKRSCKALLNHMNWEWRKGMLTRQRWRSLYKPV